MGIRRIRSTPVMNRQADIGWTLAHLSDPHLTNLADLRVGDILNKRLLGYLSWRRRRRHEHRPEVLSALVTDLVDMAPNHIAVTGDLTHLGTIREFEQAATWLQQLGDPKSVTLVPGNHDLYVATPWQETFSRWAPYMASDAEHGGNRADAPSMFPTLRVRGQFALIGVNSVFASPPFLAVGRIGQPQLDKLSALLRQTGKAGLCRIMLIHHPAAPGSIKWRKRLIDAEGLASVIQHQGVELVLHGHAHESSLNWIPSHDGRAPVIGVGSASELNQAANRRAQYHIYHFSLRSGRPEIIVSVREYSPEAGRFVALNSWPVDNNATKLSA